MGRTEFCALLLIGMTLIAILSLSSAISSLVSSVIIESTGQISTTKVTARSGSPADIQAAINLLGSAGGTVYIPAGNFTFNPPSSGAAVTIPWTGNIALMGAGIGQTLLTETTDPGTGNNVMISYNGHSGSSQGGPVRISGISFMGMVVSEASSKNYGLQIKSAKDYRIDNCQFNNFEDAGIYVDDNTGTVGNILCRGVIDHCTFDNTYKIGTGMSTLWGYGIIVVGDYYSWDPNIAHLLGYYYPSGTYTVTGGTTPEPSPTYIENCNFTRCRHCISSNGNGQYVVRYCYFQMPAPYRPVDIHGDSGNPSAPWGGRYLEAYGNTFDLTNQTYTNGDCAAFGIRGGGGVIWNNTVMVSSTSSRLGLQLGNDGESAPYDVESLYWWNNTVETKNGTQLPSSTYITAGSYVQNVNYFLRAPDLTDDGFTYTPYTYPHPLVTG
jgi:hypothetical protein